MAYSWKALTPGAALDRPAVAPSLEELYRVLCPSVKVGFEGWVLQDRRGVNQILEYEIRLNQALRKYNG